MAGRGKHLAMNVRAAHDDSITSEEHWQVSSMVGAKSEEGLVEVIIGSQRRVISSAEAKDFGLKMLQCAIGAESDEALVKVSMRNGLTIERAVEMMRAIRIEREVKK